MRLGVPFIAPRQLGAVESNPGRQFLPSVAWRTGQSGAPPDTVRCGFLSLNREADRWQPESRWRTGHVRCTPDMTGAHRTVRCPLLAVGLAMCPAQIVRPTVGPADRWLTGQSGAHRTVRCTPDSPVNFSRTSPTISRERPVCPSQPAPPDSPVHPD
jgi:hypothetical protein